MMHDAGQAGYLICGAGTLDFYGEDCIISLKIHPKKSDFDWEE